MQVVLVMFRSDGERRSFSVVRNMTVIGRREDCDLRIPVGDVSRKHCRLVRTDDGIRIEDLGSSNGTYVNRERIQESELAAGDVVGVGPVQFIVQINGVPDEDEMTAPVAEVPQQALQPVDEDEPGDMMIESPDLDELPAENEFQIEEEPAVAAHAAPTEEFALEEEPLTELPADELEEFPLEEDEPAPAPPKLPPAAKPIHDLDELELEEMPAESPAAHLIEPEPVGVKPVVESLDELDDFELEEEPAAAAPAPQAEHKTEEPADSLDELEFDESAFELEEAPSATPVAEAKPVEEIPLAPPPVPPAYSEVDIESTDENLDELELEEEHDGTPTEKTASESSWDFVIEETEASRSHHDFKLDLDAPHEQPHGQA